MLDNFFKVDKRAPKYSKLQLKPRERGNSEAVPEQEKTESVKLRTKLPKEKFLTLMLKNKEKD